MNSTPASISTSIPMQQLHPGSNGVSSITIPLIKPSTNANNITYKNQIKTSSASLHAQTSASSLNNANGKRKRESTTLNTKSKKDKKKPVPKKAKKNNTGPLPIISTNSNQTPNPNSNPNSNSNHQSNQHHNHYYISTNNNHLPNVNHSNSNNHHNNGHPSFLTTLLPSPLIYPSSKIQPKSQEFIEETSIEFETAQIIANIERLETQRQLSKQSNKPRLPTLPIKEGLEYSQSYSNSSFPLIPPIKSPSTTSNNFQQIKKK